MNNKRWTEEENNILLHSYCLYGSKHYLNHLEGIERSRKACTKHLAVLLEKEAKKKKKREEKKERKNLFSWLKSLFCK